MPYPLKLLKLGNIEKFTCFLYLFQDSICLLGKNLLIKFLFLFNHDLFFTLFFNKLFKHFLLFSTRLKGTCQAFLLFLEILDPVFDIQWGIDVIFDI